MFHCCSDRVAKIMYVIAEQTERPFIFFLFIQWRRLVEFDGAIRKKKLGSHKKVKDKKEAEIISSYETV